MAQIRALMVAAAAAVLAVGVGRPEPVDGRLNRVEGRTVQEKPGAPRAMAVVDTSEFMELVQKPAYVELQQAMARPPADRKGWATIYQKAIRLAEIQNLLFFRDRQEATDPRWAAAAAASRQAAADVAAAAAVSLQNLDKADFEMAKSRYAAIPTACNTCHKAFAREAPTIKP